MVVRGRKITGFKAVSSRFALVSAALAALPLMLLHALPATAQQEPRLVIVNSLPPPRPAGLRVLVQIENPTIPAGAAATSPPLQTTAAQAVPVRAVSPQAPPTQAAPTRTASAIVPPPASLAPATAAPSAPRAAPMQIAAAQANAIPVANTALSDAEVIARANDYFNTITMMSGRFVQVGANGSRVGGTIYIHRPGRVRFAYDEPATIDVISDGKSVVVRDRRLATQDLYPVSQTPLKFLIGDRIELGRTIPIIGVERSSTETDVILQDSTTFGGTSRITLTFDSTVRDLKQWRILDPQGFETTVSLSGLDRSARVDPSLFVINYQPVWGAN